MQVCDVFACLAAGVCGSFRIFTRSDSRSNSHVLEAHWLRQINSFMKVNEVVVSVAAYIAYVRVVVSTSSFTTRTMVYADSRHSAVAMLTRTYGAGNVLWVRELARESLSAEQIQRGRAIDAPRALDVQQPREHASVQPSRVAETETRTRVLSPAELQVKSMSDKAKQYKEQAKTLKARQQLAKAQNQLLAAQRAGRI
jgi:hypothetical protein